MPLTRAHTVGGALIVTTAAIWLFLAARLSEDAVVSGPSPDPVTAVPEPAPPLPRALSDSAIRELRNTAERAARDTLLTATP